MKLSAPFSWGLTWLLPVLLLWSAESMQAAFLSQRGPAPLRWRFDPTQLNTHSTNSVAASHPDPVPTAHSDQTHPEANAPGNLSAPTRISAPAPDSPDFVGPLLPTHSLTSSPAPVAHVNPTGSETGHGSAGHPSPVPAVSPENVVMIDTAPIVIGGQETRPIINAQMLVRFFQSPDHNTNAPLTPTVGAFPVLPVHTTTTNSRETSVIIPVQFLPPEPFTRPQSSGSSATYTVTPKH